MLVTISNKILKFDRCAFSYFATVYFNMCFRKASNFRNNFAFGEDFKKAFNNENSERNPRDKIVSSDIVLQKKNFKHRSKETEKLSTLQYTGEIIYGIHPVYLAITQQKRKLHQLFLRTELENEISPGNQSRKKDIIKVAKSAGISVKRINTQGFKYLIPGTMHQGVCLDASPLPINEWKEEEIQDSNKDTAFPLYLVLDELLDPMNVGAVIRSAYYFGVKKLFIVRGNSCKLSPTVSKASSGALEVMDIYHVENLEYFIQVMKTKKWNIISTLAYCEDKTASLNVVDASEFRINGPTVLILGNEGRGVSTSVQALCDNFLSIYPAQNLHEGIDSLNVSVASGVILHSLTKSWKNILN